MQQINARNEIPPVSYTTSNSPRVLKDKLQHNILTTSQDLPNKCNTLTKKAHPNKPLPSITPKIPSMKLELHTFKTNLFSYPMVNHIFNEDTGKKETIDSLRASKNGAVWEQPLRNKWGRLAQGNDNGIAYTDTIEFIPKEQVPNNRDVIYASFVCDHRPLKSEPWRVRIMVGRDRLSYDNELDHLPRCYWKQKSFSTASSPMHAKELDSCHWI